MEKAHPTYPVSLRDYLAAAKRNLKYPILEEPAHLMNMRKQAQDQVAEARAPSSVLTATAPEFRPAAKIPIKPKGLPSHVPHAPRAMMTMMNKSSHPLGKENLSSETADKTDISHNPQAYVDRSPESPTAISPSNHPSTFAGVKTEASFTSPISVMVPGTGQESRLYQPSEVTWTNSKTWVSEQEQLRHSFTKMRERARHLGDETWLLLPDTPFEYVSFMAEVKLVAASRMLRVIHMKQMEKRGNLAALGHFWQKTWLPPFVKLATALQDPVDGLSLVLAERSSFNAKATKGSEEKEVDWPTLGEMKADGDDRQRIKVGRFLPLPRVKDLDPGVAARGLDSRTSSVDAVAISNRWHWIDPRWYEYLKQETVEELDAETLDSWTGSLLKDIDAFANEDDLDGSNRWSY